MTDEIEQKNAISSGIIEDVILEVAWKDYASSAEEKRTLDAKANIILVANGVLLVLVVNGFNLMDKKIAFVAIGIIILSSVCCILALSLRKYSALGAMSTWKVLKDENILENVPQAKRNIMATIDKAVNDNRDQAKKIGDLIKPANILFIISLAIIAIALLVQYLSSICVFTMT